MAKKNTVTPAIEERYSITFVRRVGELEGRQGTINEERKALVTELASHYGAHVIREAKDGGINFTKNLKEEASRLGITVSALQELDEIRQGINKILGSYGWRDYLRALYPKQAPNAPTIRDEPENLKVLKAEKSEHEQAAKKLKAVAKIADGQAMLADTDEEKAELQATAKEARANAKYHEEKAKEGAALIREEAEANAGADAYGAFVEALRKLGERYKAHKDEEVQSLARQVLALLI
jgi:uncharacterized membrane protein YqiK